MGRAMLRKQCAAVSLSNSMDLPRKGGRSDTSARQRAVPQKEMPQRSTKSTRTFGEIPFVLFVPFVAVSGLKISENGAGGRPGLLPARTSLPSRHTA